MALDFAGKARATKTFIQSSRVPIITDLTTASWPNWREGFSRNLRHSIFQPNAAVARLAYRKDAHDNGRRLRIYRKVCIKF